MTQTINVTKGDKNLIKEITELGGGDITKCIQCGKCTALCPPASVDMAYRYIKLIRMIELGLREQLIEDPTPWGCTLCNRCFELCPRQANPSHTILAIRRLQASELALPMSSIEGVMSLVKTGHGVFSEHGRELRKQVGLPEEPPSAIRSEQAREEIRTILSNSKLADLGLILR